MEENLDLIINVCGDQPANQQLIDIGSDPNYIFQNDPNFTTLRLFDVEGNIINVNSWIECAHYVNGGWGLTFQDGLPGELLVLGITGIYVAGYVLFKYFKFRKSKV
tara:strand:- start:3992 stop:4309 length:318 start_codon:yes stop_codon:yes gene_type:complete